MSEERKTETWRETETERHGEMETEEERRKERTNELFLAQKLGSCFFLADIFSAPSEQSIRGAPTR